MLNCPAILKREMQVEVVQGKHKRGNSNAAILKREMQDMEWVVCPVTKHSSTAILKREMQDEKIKNELTPLLGAAEQYSKEKCKSIW